MLDPRELLSRASAGDEGAWRDLVARYQALVFQVIRAHRIGDAAAEDLFQEVFLRLHRHAHRIQEPEGLTRWIAVTARNLCLDHLERQARERGRPLDEDPADPAPGAAD